MKKKWIFSFVMLFILSVSLINGTTVRAISSEKIQIPRAEQNVFIYDEDNIINDKTEKKLNKMLVELEKKTGAEFAVISVKSLLDNSIETYSNTVFNELSIGKSGKDNGVLLLFSRSDKKVRLEIGRGLEGCLNDSKCGRILDNYFVPYREKDNYSKATKMTVEAVLNVLVKEYDISIKDLEDVSVDDDTSDFGTVAMFILILIAYIVILLGSDSVGGSSGGGSSGGFFSGGSSSSSGGGFGGGFSGGGGASR